MLPKVYGYARVSTKDQNVARQIDALRDYVADPKSDIVIDKQSGKDFNREGYQTLKQKLLHKGDTLVISSLDRLGRNYDQIRAEWSDLADKGVYIRILDFPLLNTADRSEDLLARFIADVVLAVLSFVAQNERETARRRQREGIEAAKRRGQKFGRTMVRPPEFDDAYRRMTAGEICTTEAIRVSGMAPSTFYKRVREIRQGVIPAPQ